MVGATGPGALDEGRNWRRAAMVAAPWGLAILLGLLGMASARGTQTTPTTAATPAADPGTAPATTAAEDEGDRPATGAHPTPSPAAPALSAEVELPVEVELAVLVAARRAMGTAGLADGEAADRWPLDARVSSVQTVTAEYAVATVHGLVIEQAEDGWQGPHPRAVAVLLRTTPSPAVMGPAWPLATPSIPATTPDLHPVDDPDPSVVAPLDEAGWSVEEVAAVEASDDALLRVALRGTPPGQRQAGDHVVWLLDAPGGPRLLPLEAHTDTEEKP